MIVLVFLHLNLCVKSVIGGSRCSRRSKEPRPGSGIAGSLFLIPFGGIFLTRILTLRCATLKVKGSERRKGRSLELGMRSGKRGRFRLCGLVAFGGIWY